MNIKSILATSLLTALLAGTANAEGRAGNVYDNAQTVSSAEIVKVSIQSDTKDYGINR